METRLVRVQGFLTRAQRLQKLAQERVLAADDELAGLAARLAEVASQIRTASGCSGSTAGERVRAAQYHEDLSQREAELKRLAELAAQRLATERRALRRAWREVEVWQRLEARLASREAQRLHRLEQEQIDQYAWGQKRLRVWD